MKKRLLIALALMLSIAASAQALSYYAVKRIDIAGSSVPLSFSIKPSIVVVVAAATNTDEVCIDWDGGTAVCPATNTPGNDRLAAGDKATWDLKPGVNAIGKISVIAASGTQTIYVKAIP